MAKTPPIDVNKTLMFAMRHFIREWFLNWADNVESRRTTMEHDALNVKGYYCKLEWWGPPPVLSGKIEASGDSQTEVLYECWRKWEELKEQGS